MAAGTGWVAVGTSRRFVRLFSICGTQWDIFTLPGPAVAMAANGNRLLVVYHCGLGNQSTHFQNSTSIGQYCGPVLPVEKYLLSL